VATKANKLLWITLCVAQLIYLVVVYTMPPPQDPQAVAGGIFPALLFAAISIAVGTLIYRRRALVVPIQSGRLDQAARVVAGWVLEHRPTGGLMDGLTDTAFVQVAANPALHREAHESPRSGLPLGLLELGVIGPGYFAAFLTLYVASWVFGPTNPTPAINSSDVADEPREQTGFEQRVLLPTALLIDFSRKVGDIRHSK
jgi:hypothetical protein